MSVVFHNMFLLIGTIVGAGIFSLPVALKQAGSVYFIGLMIGLTFLLGSVNILYREIVDSYREKHQLPGYAHKILGKTAARIATLLLFFSTAGALLAYLIIGGTFAAGILETSAVGGSVVFYAGVVLLVLNAGSHLEVFDIAFSVIKMVLIALLIGVAFASPVHFPLHTIPLFGNHPALAYGSILFALTGVSIMPELTKSRDIPQSVWYASSLILAVCTLFAFGYYGFITESGAVMRDPLFDLTGVFIILTPYLMLSWVAYDLLRKDLGVSHTSSLLITHGLPAVLFLLGLQSFTEVLSLTGGVFLGAIAVLITIMYRTKFPGKHTALITAIQAVFVVGMVLEILRFTGVV